MPREQLEKLKALKEDLEFEEEFLTHEFWDKILAPLD